jgi:chemotaxis protein histidine kinase CheA
MLDKNGKQIVEGQYLQVIGCKTKGDNSVYIVNKQYDNGECCLYKVLQNGELSQTKYNIYFLDNRHDKEKQVTIIEKGQLKQAMQEVKAYINGITNNEVIHSFTRATEQKAEIGLIVHFTKRVLLVGHTNTICGQYEITNIYPNGRVCMHLLGKLGEKVADNANGYYQFLPIHLNFKAEVMQRLFDENYIEILERHTITKGEAKQQQQEQTEEIAQQAQEQPTETKTEAQEQTQIQQEQTTETATEQAEKPIKEEQEQQTDTTEQTETQKIENKITATYYPINEELAYSANYVNSFSEYTKGSATASYQNAINNLVTTAQEKADKYPDYFGEIQALVNRFNKLYAEWLNRYYHIESMCPSVMISGAGNFPTRKKEKQNTARDKHWQQ